MGPQSCFLRVVDSFGREKLVGARSRAVNTILIDFHQLAFSPTEERKAVVQTTIFQVPNLPTAVCCRNEKHLDFHSWVFSHTLRCAILIRAHLHAVKGKDLRAVCLRF